MRLSYLVLAAIEPPSILATCGRPVSWTGRTTTSGLLRNVTAPHLVPDLVCTGPLFFGI